MKTFIVMKKMIILFMGFLLIFLCNYSFGQILEIDESLRRKVNRAVDNAFKQTESNSNSNTPSTETSKRTFSSFGRNISPYKTNSSEYNSNYTRSRNYKPKISINNNYAYEQENRFKKKQSEAYERKYEIIQELIDYLYDTKEPLGNVKQVNQYSRNSSSILDADISNREKTKVKNTEQYRESNDYKNTNNTNGRITDNNQNTKLNNNPNASNINTAQQNTHTNLSKDIGVTVYNLSPKYIANYALNKSGENIIDNRTNNYAERIVSEKVLNFMTKEITNDFPDNSIKKIFTEAKMALYNLVGIRTKAARDAETYFKETKSFSNVILGTPRRLINDWANGNLSEEKLDKYFDKLLYRGNKYSDKITKQAGAF